MKKKKVIKEFKFADRVVWKRELSRARHGNARLWVGAPLGWARYGIFLGYRTLRNGNVRPELDGGIPTWVANCRFRACLVCEENRSPVYVSEDDIEPETLFNMDLGLNKKRRAGK